MCCCYCCLVVYLLIVLKSLLFLFALLQCQWSGYGYRVCPCVLLDGRHRIVEGVDDLLDVILGPQISPNLCLTSHSTKSTT